MQHAPFGGWNVAIVWLMTLLGTAASAAAANETLREPKLDMSFVRLPGGCFAMGDLDAGVVGEVCVRPVAITPYEVTNAQYRRMVPSHRSGSYAGASLDGETQPVVNVSWRDAVAFAAWLGEQGPHRFRLPSEAEWEYAARANRETAWPWGADGAHAARFANLAKRSGEWRSDDAFVTTAPVGSLEPNSFGLYDMIGNAAEWVADGWVTEPDRYAHRRIDPLIEGSGPLRVRRGGSFDDPPRLARSAARDYWPADLPASFTGFRLVMEING